MKQFLGLSEAGTLALHAMVLLSGRKNQWRSAGKLAQALKAPPSHLAKVMQLLKTNGLVDSVMGPRGGYTLARDSERISLLDIYEAVEGKFLSHECMMPKRTCSGKNCIFGDYLEINIRQFRDYLSRTKLSDLRELYAPAKPLQNMGR